MDRYSLDMADVMPKDVAQADFLDVNASLELLELEKLRASGASYLKGQAARARHDPATRLPDLKLPAQSPGPTDAATILWLRAQLELSQEREQQLAQRIDEDHQLFKALEGQMVMMQHQQYVAATRLRDSQHETARVRAVLEDASHLLNNCAHLDASIAQAKRLLDKGTAHLHAQASLVQACLDEPDMASPLAHGPIPLEEPSPASSRLSSPGMHSTHATPYPSHPPHRKVSAGAAGAAPTPGGLVPVPPQQATPVANPTPVTVAAIPIPTPAPAASTAIPAAAPVVAASEAPSRSRPASRRTTRRIHTVEGALDAELSEQPSSVFSDSFDGELLPDEPQHHRSSQPAVFRSQLAHASPLPVTPTTTAAVLPLTPATFTGQSVIMGTQVSQYDNPVYGSGKSSGGSDHARAAQVGRSAVQPIDTRARDPTYPVRQLDMDLEASTPLFASPPPPTSLPTASQATQTDSDNQMLLAKVQLAEQQVANQLLDQELQEAKQQLQQVNNSLQQELQQLDAQLQLAKAQLEARDTELGGTAKQLHQQGAELAGVVQQLEARDAQLQATQRKLQACESQLQEAQSQLQQVKSQATEANIQLAARQTELLQSRAQVQSSQQLLAGEQEACAALKADIAQLREELEQVQFQDTKLTRDSQLRDVELAAARAKVASLEDDVVQLKAQIEQAHAAAAEHLETTAQLEAVNEELKRLQQDLRAQAVEAQRAQEAAGQQLVELQTAHHAKAHMAREVVSARQELVARESAILSLNEQLAAAKDLFDKQEVAAKEQVDALQRQLASKDAEVNALFEQLGSQQAQMQELCGQKSQQDSGLKQALSELAAVQDKAREAQAEAAGLRTELRAAQGEVKALRLQVRGAQEESNAVKAELESKVATLDKTAASMRAAAQLADSQQTEMLALQVRLADVVTQLEAAQVISRDQERDLSAAHQQHADMEAQLATSQQMIQTARLEVQEARQALDVKAEEMQHVQDLMLVNAGEMSALRRELTSLSQELQGKRLELVTVQQELDGKQVEVSAVQQELQVQRLELVSLRQQLLDEQCEVDAVSKDLETAQQEVQQVKLQLAARQVELDQARQGLGDTQALLGDKQAEADAVKEQLRVRQQEVEQLREELAVQQQEVEQARQALEREAQALLVIQDSFQACKSQLQAVKAELKGKHREVLGLQADCSRHEQRAQEMQEALHEAQSTRAAAEVELQQQAGQHVNSVSGLQQSYDRLKVEHEAVLAMRLQETLGLQELSKVLHSETQTLAARVSHVTDVLHVQLQHRQSQLQQLAAQLSIPCPVLPSLPVTTPAVMCSPRLHPPGPGAGQTTAGVVVADAALAVALCEDVLPASHATNSALGTAARSRIPNKPWTPSDLSQHTPRSLAQSVHNSPRSRLAVSPSSNRTTLDDHTVPVPASPTPLSRLQLELQALQSQLLVECQRTVQAQLHRQLAETELLVMVQRLQEQQEALQARQQRVCAQGTQTEGPKVAAQAIQTDDPKLQAQSAQTEQQQAVPKAHEAARVGVAAHGTSAALVEGMLRGDTCAPGTEETAASQAGVIRYQQELYQATQALQVQYDEAQRLNRLLWAHNAQLSQECAVLKDQVLSLASVATMHGPQEPVPTVDAATAVSAGGMEPRVSQGFSCDGPGDGHDAPRRSSYASTSTASVAGSDRPSSVATPQGIISASSSVVSHGGSSASDARVAGYGAAAVAADERARLMMGLAAGDRQVKNLQELLGSKDRVVSALQGQLLGVCEDIRAFESMVSKVEVLTSALTRKAAGGKGIQQLVACPPA